MLTGVLGEVWGGVGLFHRVYNACYSYTFCIVIHRMVDFETRIDQLFRYAKGWGLTDRAAAGYTILAIWGEHYGQQAPAITSGKRSQADQARLSAGFLAGLPGIYKPAANSKHLTGNAFDV